MTKILLIPIGIFAFLLILDKFTRKGKVNRKKVKIQEVTKVTSKAHEEMIEYSRENSYELGFNRTNNGFKRPIELRMRGMTKEQEIQYINSLMKNERYSKAMKSYVPLKNLHTEKSLEGVTIKVFIDSIKDTKVIARDNTAMLEIELGGGYYSMAGEFVLINLDKEGGYIKVNFVLRDNQNPH